MSRTPSLIPLAFVLSAVSASVVAQAQGMPVPPPMPTTTPAAMTQAPAKVGMPGSAQTAQVGSVVEPPAMKPGVVSSAPAAMGGRPGVISSPSAVANPMVANQVAAAGYGSLAPASAVAGAVPSPVVGDAVSMRPTMAEINDLVWLLGPDQQPLPLRYEAMELGPDIFLTIPPESEIKLMLPGVAMQQGSNFKNYISSYFANRMGASAAARSRQLARAEEWLRRTNEQYLMLGPDPWKQYQFVLMARDHALSFYPEVQKQGPVEIDSLVVKASALIQRIQGALNVLPTHESKLHWYQLMVQLKESLTLYQTQIDAVDGQVLGVVGGFLEKYPPPVKPSGAPPAKPGEVNPLMGAQPGAGAMSEKAVAAQTKAPPIDMSSSSNVTGVVLGALALLIGFGVYMRKKLTKKAVSGSASGPKSTEA